MAKVTVSFVTEEDDKQISIESDQERNKDYTGKTKTKFRYGDTAYFRVYSHEPDTIQAISTDGDISDLGLFSDIITGEITTFISESSAATGKPIKNIYGYEWLGNSLGSITMIDPYSVRSSEAPSVADDNIAMASISYQTSYRLFGLTLSKKDMDEYPVIVYVRSLDV